MNLCEKEKWCNHDNYTTFSYYFLFCITSLLENDSN